MAEQSEADSAQRSRTGVDFETLAEHLRPLGNPTRLQILHLVTEPLYLEEISSRTHLSRQGVRKHLDALVGLGVVRKQLGRRDFGPVTEYVLDLPRLFLLSAEFGKLGSLRPARATTEAALTVDQAPTTPAPRRRGSGTPCLTLVRGVNEGTLFELADQPGRAWTIGRAKNVDIRLDYDPFASNRHAEIRREQRGFVLADLYSRNGTWLNWQRLERGGTEPLERGDIVGVGKSLLVFQVRAGT